MRTLSPKHFGMISGGNRAKSHSHREAGELDFLAIIEKKYVETPLLQLMLEISLVAASVALGLATGAANQNDFIFDDDF